MFSNILRLVNINFGNSKFDYTKLDILIIYSYIITFIEINNDFKNRIIRGY